MSTNSVNLTYRADITDLRRKLASVPGITEAEARKSIKAIEAAIKAQERAANAAAAAAKRSSSTAAPATVQTLKMASSLTAAGEGAAKLKSGLDPLAAAIGQISPEAQGATQAVSAMVGGLDGIAKVVSSLGISLPVLGVALAAVATAGVVAANAWQSGREEITLLNARVEEYQRLLKGLPALQQAAAAGSKALALQQADLEIQNAVLTGALTEEEAALTRQIGTLGEMGKASTLLAYQRLQAASAERAVHQATLESTQASLSDMIAAEERMRVLDREIAAAEEDIAATEAQTDQAQELARQNWELTQAIKARSAETRASATATRDSASADREAVAAAAAAEAELAAAVATQEGQIERLRQIRESAYQGTLDGVDALIRRQELELAQVRALGMASGDRAAASEALAAVELRQAQELSEALARVDAEAQARRDKMRTDELAQERAAADAKIGLAYEVAGLVGTLAEGAQARGGAAAVRAWKVGQAAAATQTVIQGATAGVRAYADLGPIAGAIAAVGIGIQTISALARINAQQPPAYYAGSPMIYAEPGSSPAILHQGEAVLTRQGRQALGDSAIREANRGRAPQVMPIVDLRIEGREIGAVAATDARRGGRLSDEITRRTGRLGRA